MEIIITKKENSIGVKADGPVTAYDMTDLLLSTLLGQYNSMVTEATEELKEPVREHLFDVFNQAASTLLAQFAPDIDMRPDIMADAILAEEQKIANTLLASKKAERDLE